MIKNNASHGTGALIEDIIFVSSAQKPMSVQSLISIDYLLDANIILNYKNNS